MPFSYLVAELAAAFTAVGVAVARKLVAIVH